MGWARDGSSSDSHADVDRYTLLVDPVCDLETAAGSEMCRKRRTDLQTEQRLHFFAVDGADDSRLSLH